MMVIYVLRDQKDGSVRYVGVTKRTLEARLIAHMYEAKRSQSHRGNWLRSLARPPLIESFASVLPGASWAEVEKQCIKQFREEGARLTNGTDGGEGVWGRVWSPNAEQRKRMREAQIGKRASDQTRELRSQTLKLRYRDPALMEERQELARNAARSANGRKAASERMTAIWADPVRAARMREAMRGSRERKAWAEMAECLGE